MFDVLRQVIHPGIPIGMQTPGAIVFHFVIQVIAVLVIDIKRRPCIMDIDPQCVFTTHHDTSFQVPWLLGFVSPLARTQTGSNCIFRLLHSQFAIKFHNLRVLEIR